MSSLPPDNAADDVAVVAARVPTPPEQESEVCWTE